MKNKDLFRIIFLSAAINLLLAAALYAGGSIYFVGAAFASFLLLLSFPLGMILIKFIRLGYIKILILIFVIDVSFIILAFRFDIFTESGVEINIGYILGLAQFLVYQVLSLLVAHFILKTLSAGK